MEIVSATKFRTNQGKFLMAARKGETILLTSRYGNFKITPISADDKLVEEDIRISISEVRDHLNGKIDLPLAKDIIF